MCLNRTFYCTRNVSCFNRSKIPDCNTYMLPPQGIGNILKYRVCRQKFDDYKYKTLEKILRQIIFTFIHTG